MAQDIGSKAGSPRDWFGKALVKLAPQFDFLYVDMDLAGGTGGFHFREAYPNRVIQCGIAEQAAAGIAAGLAAGTGQPVIFSTFATFGLRAIEILQLQAFYNDVPVICIFSHLGVDTGPDGASVQSLNHTAIWRSIPGNIPVVHPSCPNEMEGALRWLLNRNGPAVILTGRSPVELGSWADEIEPDHFEFQASAKYPAWDICVYSGGNDIALLGSGYVVDRCVRVARQLYELGIGATVYSVPVLKPIDPIGIEGLVKAGQPIITVEDHGPAGGLFEAVAGIVARTGAGIRVEPVYVQGWGQSGEPEELAARYGIDVKGIMEAVKRVLNGV